MANKFSEEKLMALAVAEIKSKRSAFWDEGDPFILSEAEFHAQWESVDNWYTDTQHGGLKSQNGVLELQTQPIKELQALQSRNSKEPSEKCATPQVSRNSRSWFRSSSSSRRERRCG
jgi:hypothetical protein